MKPSSTSWLHGAVPPVGMAPRPHDANPTVRITYPFSVAPSRGSQTPGKGTSQRQTPAWWVSMVGAVATVLVLGSSMHNPARTAETSDHVVVDQRPTDLDDFSRNPAYQQFFSQPVRWSAQACPSYASQGECAVLRAPRNWEDPASGTVTIGLRRLPGAMNPKPSRLLLSHGGGPGGSQLGFSSRVTSALGLGSGHLAVGVDTRGSGMATPVRCPTAPQAPTAPERATTSELAAYFRRLTAHAQTCAQSTGSLYAFASTDQAVRDLNLVRHLLGYAVADYFGTSYGAWLGTTARQMFPHRFDRVVLDSAVDWTVSVRSHSVEGQIDSYQEVLAKGFAPWAALHQAKLGLGATPDAVLASIAAFREGVRAGKLDGVSLRQFDAVVCAAMLNTSRWEVLAQGLSTWGRSTRSPDAMWRTALGWIGGAAGSNPHLLRAVMCNDTGTWGTAESWAATMHQLLRVRPIAASRQLALACVEWPRPATLSSQLRSRTAGDVLILQHENDPATPWFPVQRALERARANSVGSVHDRSGNEGSGNDGAAPERSSATLAVGSSTEPLQPGAGLGAGTRTVLVQGSFGHGVLGNPCAREAARSYLQNGYLPGADIACKPLPLPWVAEP